MCWHADHARLGAQVLGVFGKAGDGVFTTAKEQVVHFLRIPEAIRIQRLRQGEHHMKISGRQQVSLPGFYPFLPACALAFGAMAVTATIVADAQVYTTIASLHMPA